MVQRLVALLRGINVGKNKRVAMAELRQLLVDLGYSDVTTHLNSGNAVFSCPELAAAAAGERIRLGIANELGVECAVMTRTGTELSRVVAANPLVDLATDPAKYLVAFLSGSPEDAAVQALHARDFGVDLIRVVGSEAYLWCPAGIQASPLTKLAWNSQLGVSATARNWTTVRKLAELAASTD